MTGKSKNIFHAVSRQSESWGNFERASSKSSQAHFHQKCIKIECFFGDIGKKL